MKISKILKPDTVILNLQAKDKEEVIEKMLDVLVKTKKINRKNRNKLKKALLARELLGSTGIGQGVGIPHAKDDSLKKLVACCAISPRGVDFDALDGEPVHIFFMLLAPKTAAGEHLKALAKISRLVKDKFFRSSLLQSKSPKDLIERIKREEEKID